MHSSRHLVELLEAGRKAGDRLASVGRLVDLLKGPHDHVLHVLVGIARALFGDREDRRLGFVEELFERPIVTVAAGDDLVARADQSADDLLLADDPGVRLDVRDARDRVAQRKQILIAPNGCELSAVHQRFTQGDVVDRLAPAKELSHRLEDLAVCLAVEVLGGQLLENDVDRVVLEQNAAEYRALRFKSVRGYLTGLLS